MDNFHKFLSDMKQLLELYLLNQEPVWVPELINSKKSLETHTFAKDILHLCLNATKSEGLLVAFDILVTLYEQ